MNEKKNTPNFIPTFSWLCTHPAYFFAFGLGSGLIRPAPGTWGTLAGWLLFIPMQMFCPLWGLFTIISLSFIIGIWFCDKAGKTLGVADYGGIVWDEIVAIWLVLCFVPATLVWQLFAFAAFRLFDIVKPMPIKYFDKKLKHGFGVMFDDILAALYAILILRVALYLIQYFGSN